jgi:hypothetical protein|tara:strand:+ start:296 stop:484 length:189 start_codon:yes stop_codon:yes gene_type:complete
LGKHPAGSRNPWKEYADNSFVNLSSLNRIGQARGRNTLPPSDALSLKWRFIVAIDESIHFFI